MQNDHLITVHLYRTVSSIKFIGFRVIYSLNLKTRFAFQTRCIGRESFDNKFCHFSQNTLLNLQKVSIRTFPTKQYTSFITCTSCTCRVSSLTMNMISINYAAALR